jgi:hypothetical protein
MMTEYVKNTKPALIKNKFVISIVKELGSFSKASRENGKVERTKIKSYFSIFQC